MTQTVSLTGVDRCCSRDDSAVSIKDVRSIRDNENQHDVKCDSRGRRVKDTDDRLVAKRSADKARHYVRIDDEIEIRDSMGRSYYDRMPVATDDEEYFTSAEDIDSDEDTVFVTGTHRQSADASVLPTRRPAEVLSNREKDLRDRKIISRLLVCDSFTPDVPDPYDKYTRGSRGRSSHSTSKEGRQRTTTRHDTAERSRGKYCRKSTDVIDSDDDRDHSSDRHRTRDKLKRRSHGKDTDYDESDKDYKRRDRHSRSSQGRHKDNRSHKSGSDSDSSRRSSSRSRGSSRHGHSVERSCNWSTSPAPPLIDKRLNSTDLCHSRSLEKRKRHHCGRRNSDSSSRESGHRRRRRRSSDSDSADSSTSPRRKSRSSSRTRHTTKNSRYHHIKPDKFDGSGCIETYVIKFESCARYNGWNEEDKAAYLRAALTGGASMTIWRDATATYSEIVEKLRSRYGSRGQQEKFRLEVRFRKRKHDESLQELAEDIERLIILSYPGADLTIIDVLAKEAFIDALDPQLQTKIREREPQTMKETVVLALKLEVLHKSTGTQKESARARGSYVDGRNKDRHFVPEKSATERRQDATGNRPDEIAQMRNCLERLSREMCELREEMRRQAQSTSTSSYGGQTAERQSFSSPGSTPPPTRASNTDHIWQYRYFGIL